MSAKQEGFAVWEAQVPARIKKEGIWRFIGYRKALYLYDLIWEDTNDWCKDRRGRPIVSQLISSVGSISANLEEGYGRETRKQTVSFYQVSLASARETKGWLYRARHLMQAETMEKRLELVDEVIALLVNEIRIQKRGIGPK
jgi:four helix bundle protein